MRTLDNVSRLGESGSGVSQGYLRVKHRGAFREERKMTTRGTCCSRIAARVLGWPQWQAVPTRTGRHRWRSHVPLTATRHHVVGLTIGIVGALSLVPAAVGDVESIVGLYDADGVHFEVEFTDPIRFACGWHFQLYIDSDNEGATGYGHGFDLLVRGVELADPVHVYLRRAEGGDGPGGWGQAVGVVLFEMVTERCLTLDIPLGVGDLTDGSFRFAFEVYYQGCLVHLVSDQYTQQVPAGPASGDANSDGCVDLLDHPAFTDCMGGPGRLPHPTPPTTFDLCLTAIDFDGDTDVDVRDFALWLPSFSSSGT